MAEAIKQKARNVAAGLCSAGFIVLPAVNREACVLPAGAPPLSPVRPQTVLTCSVSVLYHRPQTVLTCSCSVSPPPDYADMFSLCSVSPPPDYADMFSSCSVSTPSPPVPDPVDMLSPCAVSSPPPPSRPQTGLTCCHPVLYRYHHPLPPSDRVDMLSPLFCIAPFPLPARHE